MRRARGGKGSSSGQRGKRERRLRLRYARVWLAAGEARDTAGLDSILDSLATASQASSSEIGVGAREALSPGVRRARPELFPLMVPHGERGTSGEASAPLRRVAEERTSYDPADHRESAPTEGGA